MCYKASYKAGIIGEPRAMSARDDYQLISSLWTRYTFNGKVTRSCVGYARLKADFHAEGGPYVRLPKTEVPFHREPDGSDISRIVSMLGECHNCAKLDLICFGKLHIKPRTRGRRESGWKTTNWVK